MKNKLNWLELVLVLTPFVLLAVFWSDIPERVPIHWNLAGRIDGWASKQFGMLVSPVTSLVIVALLHFLPRLDPKLRKEQQTAGRMGPALRFIRVSLAAFFFVVFLALLGAARGNFSAVDRVVPSSVLLLLAVLGNYLGVLRPNYFIGIRTPWTLENTETWRATHRLGGRLMFFGSLVLLVSQFFLSEPTFTLVLMTAVLALAIWGLLYSWHHARTSAVSAHQL